MPNLSPKPTIHRTAALIVTAALVIAACGDADDESTSEVPPEAASVVNRSAEPVGANRAVLEVDSTWQWQLDGPINTSYDVDVYDIDLFESPTATIAELSDDGRIVICYFSAGSYEEWREDAQGLPVAALGTPLDGWEDERWVDVRSEAVRDLMETRLDLAVSKGCDGVEPDNVAAYDDETGFDFTLEDQLAYNRFLADAAHDRGLLIGLKNALDQIPDLVDQFDFAVNEQCHEYDECEMNRPFVNAGKPVFNAEYAADLVGDPETVCANAAAAGIRTLLLSIDLDDSLRISCD
ncbi:MAG: endo alpha-1,4 polygalactosaminidase [Acidimicrobiia bacterium]|nr:endo alpha-1,4 polygalactosaminidase [Acidimicrobiia bacterium]